MSARGRHPIHWPTFWAGDVKAIAGIVRVDGHPYVFCGDPRDASGQPLAPAVTQTNLTITPTQSRYTLHAGGITLTVTFLSPVETHDLRRLSMPLSYITIQAQSNDGAAHDVSIYLDISGEWAYGDPTALIAWKREHIAASTGTITALTVTPANPRVLAEVRDYPAWGTALLAVYDAPDVTFQIGADTEVRARGATQGRLGNSVDRRMPRAINDHWPVFAFNKNLGRVGPQPGQPFTLVVGHVREPAVSYVGKPLAPLWRSYWPSWRGMVSFALDDAPAARRRAAAFDARLLAAASSAAGGGTEGTQYAALCALALRQAFGGTELINSPSGTPWLFLKEISCDGNVSTVDVIYPGCPVLIYTNPELLRLLLEPIIDNCELPPGQGGWPEQFAIHDIGSSYPNATGHPGGAGTEEDMPVEETANMLIMVAAYLRRTAHRDAQAFARQHYPLFKKWADYLTADNGYGRANALDPEYQNQTDDFTGKIAHSSNLALKGIVGVGAMGIIASAAGNTSDAEHYGSLARSYIEQWVTLSQDPSKKHLMLTYTEPANSSSPATNGTGTWSLKYNAYSDKLLGLNLIPGSVLAEEAAWYKTQEGPYGIPLDNRHAPPDGNPYTKGDWELWTAAATPDAGLRADIIRLLYTFANTTSSRVPFTDWYNTATGTQEGFQARPVIGAMFALLTVQAQQTASRHR